MSLGNNIKRLRVANNMSQQDLAKLLNKKVQNTISQYENNKREPSLKDLIVLCNYFNVSIEELYEESVIHGKNVERLSAEEVMKEINELVDNSDMTEEQKNMIKSTTSFVVGSKKEDEK